MWRSCALIQVLSPEEAQRVFYHLIQALEPDSPIYILGNILDDNRLSPPDTVTMNGLFLNLYDAGQAYTEQTYRPWLAAAGFTSTAYRNYPASLAGDSGGIKPCVYSLCNWYRTYEMDI